RARPHLPSGCHRRRIGHGGRARRRALPRVTSPIPHRHPGLIATPLKEKPVSATDVTEATFTEEVLEADGTVLVDFWAEWCGPCRAVSPILDQIASENSEKIRVVKLNVDETPQLATKYQITSLPAMTCHR